MCKTRPFITDRYGKFDEIVKNLSETCNRCSEILQVGEFPIHQKCCKSLYLKALSIFKSLPKDKRDLFKSIFSDHDFIVPRDLYETMASSGLELQTEVAEYLIESEAGEGTFSGRLINGKPNGFGYFTNRDI
jgi:hypothetical protein